MALVDEAPGIPRALEPVTRRRLLSWALTVMAVSAVCGIAYPYVRYRAVSRDGIRGFEDRWTEPPRGVLTEDLCVAASNSSGQRWEEIADRGEETNLLRIVGPENIVESAALRRKTGDYDVAHFNHEGVFQGGYRKRDEVKSPLTEAQAREILGPLLEPDGMPWPWWTKLPYFAGHLRGE